MRRARARFGVDLPPWLGGDDDEPEPTLLGASEGVVAPRRPRSAKEAAIAVAGLIEHFQAQALPGSQPLWARLKTMAGQWRARIAEGEYPTRTLSLRGSGAGRLKQWVLAARERDVLHEMGAVYRRARVELDLLDNEFPGSVATQAVEIMLDVETSNAAAAEATGALAPDLIPGDGPGGIPNPAERFRQWVLDHRLALTLGALGIGAAGVGILILTAMVAAAPVVAPIVGPAAATWLQRRAAASYPPQLPPPADQDAFGGRAWIGAEWNDL